MNAPYPKDVLVVDLSVSRPQVALLKSMDEAPMWLGGLEHKACESEDEDEELVQCARDLRNFRSRVSNLVILIVSQRSADDIPVRCLDIAPTAIYVVTKLTALSAVVPSVCLSFYTIDRPTNRLWLVVTRNGETRSALCGPKTIDPSALSEMQNSMAILGIARIEYALNGEEGRPAKHDNAQVVTREGICRGALKAVVRSFANDGVHHYRDSLGRINISVRATHETTYPVIQVTRPVFDIDDSTLMEQVDGHPVVLAVDRRVYALYGGQIDSFALRLRQPVHKVLIDGAESAKTGKQVVRLCREAADSEIPRHGVFVAVGGGVTLDTVGLAASLYRRGVPYVRVPTTLIGLIDAGIGIKQAVNFGGTKSALGTFYAPASVIVDQHFLRTLPRIAISCGLAEIIKIALVTDRVLFCSLEQYGDELFESRCMAPGDIATWVLTRATHLMLEELQPNLFEFDTQRAVDFGHSFSPEIESVSGYAVPHGIAVAMDMLLSTALAIQLKICSATTLARLLKLFKAFDLPTEDVSLSDEQLLTALARVRQRRRGQLNLVVPGAVGEAVFVQGVAHEDLAAARLILRKHRVQHTEGAHVGVCL